MIGSIKAELLMKLLVVRLSNEAATKASELGSARVELFMTRLLRTYPTLTDSGPGDDKRGV